MKKEYQKPIVELVNFSVNDIIMASNYSDFNNDKYIDFDTNWF